MTAETDVDIIYTTKDKEGSGLLEVNTDQEWVEEFLKEYDEYKSKYIIQSVSRRCTRTPTLCSIYHSMELAIFLIHLMSHKLCAF